MVCVCSDLCPLQLQSSLLFSLLLALTTPLRPLLFQRHIWIRRPASVGISWTLRTDSTYYITYMHAEWSLLLKEASQNNCFFHTPICSGPIWTVTKTAKFQHINIWPLACQYIFSIQILGTLWWMAYWNIPLYGTNHNWGNLQIEVLKLEYQKWFNLTGKN